MVKEKEKEKEAFKQLKKLVFGTSTKLIPIETGATALGIPDIYFETPIRPGWIELKRIVWPKRKHTKIKIKYRPKQFEFLTEHNKKYGIYSRAFLCVIDENKVIRFFAGRGIRKEYTQDEFYNGIIIGKENGSLLFNLLSAH